MMADRGVLVRRLNANENLGSMDILCTDKTGTLPEGVIQVEGHMTPQAPRRPKSKRPCTLLQRFLRMGNAAVKSPKNVYRRFLEFEERAAAIYVQLASRFSEDPKLSSFWLDMAMHEKQHAGLLQFCLGDGLYASDLPDRAEIQKVAALFERLENRAADPKLTVEDAFLLAVELESSELNAIYCYLTTTLHRSM